MIKRTTFTNSKILTTKQQQQNHIFFLFAAVKFSQIFFQFPKLFLYACLEPIYLFPYTIFKEVTMMIAIILLRQYFYQLHEVLFLLKHIQQPKSLQKRIYLNKSRYTLNHNFKQESALIWSFYLFIFTYLLDYLGIL